MVMKIAIQMDPLESIDSGTDSSWMMILEALRRGHQVFHYCVDGLSFGDRDIFARVQEIRIPTPALQGRAGLTDVQPGAPTMLELAQCDVVLMRQDPPFNMGYLSATYILERLPPSVVVVNNPGEVRNAPEKILAMDFPDLMPPTLISSDRTMLEDFRTTHGDVIIKPLYGNGGVGIVRLRPEDENFAALFDLHQMHWGTPMQMQRYLPEVTSGDRRILLIDGAPVGAIDRLPPEGHLRANLHVGGRARKATLDARDQEICAAIGPTLRRLGMIFVGIDIIGGFLTEINVTSPTGIQEVNRFDDIRIESLLWDAIERHVRERAG